MIVVHEKVKKLDFRLAPGVLSVQHVIFAVSHVAEDIVGRAMRLSHYS